MVPALGRLVIPKMSVHRLLEEQCWSKIHLKGSGPSGLKCLRPSECRLLESLLGETLWWRGLFDNPARPLLLVELDEGSSPNILDGGVLHVSIGRTGVPYCCAGEETFFRSGGQRKR
jgi:hypothetical protein